MKKKVHISVRLQNLVQLSHHVQFLNDLKSCKLIIFIHIFSGKDLGHFTDGSIIMDARGTTFCDQLKTESQVFEPASLCFLSRGANTLSSAAELFHCYYPNAFLKHFCCWDVTNIKQRQRPHCAALEANSRPPRLLTPSPPPFSRQPPTFSHYPTKLFKYPRMSHPNIPA